MQSLRSFGLQIHLVAMTFIFFSVLASGADDIDYPGGIEQKDLFVSGEGGYDTYRIPSIVVAKNGDLLVFCEGRKLSSSDTGDIDLLLRRSTDNGKSWSEKEVLWDDSNNTCGNPCPVVDDITGDIFLFLTWNLGSDIEKEIVKGEGRDTRRVFIAKSKDNGVSWSKPDEITKSVKAEYWRWYATGPGHGIQLKYGAKKGRLVVPCDHSFPEFAPEQFWGAHVVYSDDHGKSWHVSKPVLPGLNENEVVEMLDGSLMMNARNYLYRGSRAIIVSMDCGETWPYVSFQSSLQEPRCQASIIRYSPNQFVDKSIILFSNPNHNKKRINMSVRLSYDEAKTWPVVKSLHKGCSAYSCLAILPDGKIACFYEAGEDSLYERITLAIFTLDWLTSGENGCS